MADTWEITEHCCRHCYGRVLKRVEKVRATSFNGVTMGATATICRCANCGSEVHGGHRDLCCCGIKTGGKTDRLKCERQPNPTPEFPAEIVVVEVR